MKWITILTVMIHHNKTISESYLTLVYEAESQAWNAEVTKQFRPEKKIGSPRRHSRWVDLGALPGSFSIGVFRLHSDRVHPSHPVVTLITRDWQTIEDSIVCLRARKKLSFRVCPFRHGMTRRSHLRSHSLRVVVVTLQLGIKCFVNFNWCITVSRSWFRLSWAGAVL